MGPNTGIGVIIDAFHFNEYRKPEKHQQEELRKAIAFLMDKTKRAQAQATVTSFLDKTVRNREKYLSEGIGSYHGGRKKKLSDECGAPRTE